MCRGGTNINKKKLPALQEIHLWICCIFCWIKDETFRCRSIFFSIFGTDMKNVFPTRNNKQRLCLINPLRSTVVPPTSWMKASFHVPLYLQPFHSFASPDKLSHRSHKFCSCQTCLQRHLRWNCRYQHLWTQLHNWLASSPFAVPRAPSLFYACESFVH